MSLDQTVCDLAEPLSKRQLGLLLGTQRLVVAIWEFIVPGGQSCSQNIPFWEPLPCLLVLGAYHSPMNWQQSQDALGWAARQPGAWSCRSTPVPWLPGPRRQLHQDPVSPTSGHQILFEAWPQPTHLRASTAISIPQ